MRIALLAAALLGALAVVLGFALTREDDQPAFRGSVPPEGLVLPQAVADSPGVAGKALAVTFLDTQCTDACPIAASQVAEAMRLLVDDRGRVLALAYSVDPLNDTVRSAIMGFDNSTLSDLADRTLRLAQRRREP